MSHAVTWLDVFTDVPLAGAGFLDPGRFTAPTPPGLPPLSRLRARLLSAAGSQRLPLAASHGDWTPWNMAVAEDAVEVWDWERFSVDVPQGLDIVHFLASAIDHDHHPGPLEAHLLDDLARLLEVCGLDRRLARALLCAYLVDLSARYAGDLAVAPAPAVERRLRWAVRLFTDHVPHLEAQEAS